MALLLYKYPKCYLLLVLLIYRNFKTKNNLYTKSVYIEN
nr:MAG TPA: hypothetical protein [Caudoviricetes sp.]